MRQAQKIHGFYGLNTFLTESGDNGVLIFDSFDRQTEDDFLAALQELYDGIRRVFSRLTKGICCFWLKKVGGV